MTRLREDQGGWVLVTTLVLMLIMAGFGMSVVAFSDTEEQQSAIGRQRETAFNVSEAALNTQIYALSRQWPGNGAATTTSLQYPTSCTQASTDTKCPSAPTITGLFSSPDTGTPATWTTMVRDNTSGAGATFWSESMVSSAAKYDANLDGRLWVRAQSVARGRTRTMVALVAVETQSEDLPHVTLLAGKLDISNNGKKVIIDTQGPSSSTVGPVQVRCTPAVNESGPCLGHEVGSGSTKTLADLDQLLDSQVSPNETSSGYSGGDALSADALARLESRAKTDGTHYTSCPSSLTGAVVYIKVAAATQCGYTSNSVFNSSTAPGMVIMERGKLSLGGNLTYNGLLYHANLDDSSGTLIELGGTVEVNGGAIIDGPGLFVAGSSKVNLVFDDRAFDNVQSYGNAGLIQNTWREITP